MSAPGWLEEGRAWAEGLLEQVLPGEGEAPERLHAAMRYAVLGGGKRLRPALARLLCLELGGVEAHAAGARPCTWPSTRPPRSWWATRC